MLSDRTAVMMRKRSILIRTYQELIRIPTFVERFEYLQLFGAVGRETFGFDRYINQQFYTSTQWRNIRHHVIARDLGLDLSMEGYEIHDKVIIHHMNPMLPSDIIYGNEDILNPDHLITTNQRTHNAIHYGDASLLPQELVVRYPGDTKLW